MSEPSKNPDPPKKPEPRTAGAANTKENVFNLPDYPEDEPGAANEDPSEEKIGFTEALKMKSKDWAKAARRKSGQILTGFGGKKDENKKDEDKRDGDKRDEDKRGGDKRDEDKRDEDKGWRQ
ncbi:uncharacterized protein M421DRAFT_112649 [Didymella exigua CBS 183.55]|uniref:Uncharacterized protein n=1 Tax=Didymella exigua CBS 183.55 TaxID=1150837 RepID=A0A6A5S3T0_9PLEO|nr:uncharacterized protein M421DRAFT_112649 [Didymella exigua CBS 183.55]KAF1934094.1 hypothetical protein M421DRAFT_112649 [Didymella exigua CBS 183.55]